MSIDNILWIIGISVVIVNFIGGLWIYLYIKNNKKIDELDNEDMPL